MQRALFPAVHWLNQHYLFSLEKKNLLHRPAQILLADKTKHSEDMRPKSHLSSPVCTIFCCSGAGIKSTFPTPATQTSPRAAQRFTFHEGRGKEIFHSFFSFLQVLGLFGFFLSCGEKAIMQFQPVNQHSKEGG